MYPPELQRLKYLVACGKSERFCACAGLSPGMRQPVCQTVTKNYFRPYAAELKVAPQGFFAD